MGSDVKRIRHAKKRAFLDAFAKLGTLTHAAQVAGCNRNSHYDWLRSDPDYASAFDEACTKAVDNLEAEARRRAVLGVDEPVYYQGEQVGTVKKYSDTLLIFLLKGALPEKYRERISVVTEDAVDAEIRRLTAELERRRTEVVEARASEVPALGTGDLGGEQQLSEDRALAP